MNNWITPTADGVAETLADGIDSFHYGYDWELDYERDGNVIAVTVTPQDMDTGVRLDQRKAHFRAVVVEGEGEAEPIVLERPDMRDGLAFEGDPFNPDPDRDGWQVSAADRFGHTTMPESAVSILVRGTGHISIVEARRKAAALVAMADAVEAAQADKDGQR